MGKTETIAAAKDQYKQSTATMQDDALTTFGSACYDGGKADGASPGGFTQEDVNAAVAAAQAADQVHMKELSDQIGLDADALAAVKAANAAVVAKVLADLGVQPAAS